MRRAFTVLAIAALLLAAFAVGASSADVTCGPVNLTTVGNQTLACSDGGTFWGTYTAPVEAPPAPPTNFVATTHNTEIDLSWYQSDYFGGQYADGYHIYRAVDGLPNGPWTLYKTVDATAQPACSPLTCTFNDTGLTVGHEYFYRIGAFNDGGEAPLTGIAQGTIVAPACAPTTPTLSANGTTLTWSAPCDIGFTVLAVNGTQFTYVADTAAPPFVAAPGRCYEVYGWNASYAYSAPSNEVCV